MWIFSRSLAIFLLAAVLICAPASFLSSTFSAPQNAHAVGASLYLGPANGTFTVGSTFTVSLYLNSGGQAVNAVQANLVFPPDKLQVVSPSSGQSLIRVWVDQPSYSNINGTLHFQGVIPTPGINTNAGLLSTITFRVKSTSTASVRIIDSNVYLNDGYGTNILSQTTNGIYELILPPPEGPIVSSPTNPDQNKWYRTGTVALQWEAPTGTQGFSYTMSDDPVEQPGDVSKGTQTQVSYAKLTDGTHYFHIKALRAGVWGGVTNFVVHVDNVPPANFNVELLPDTVTSNRRPVIEFQTTDAASGIDHYEIHVIPLLTPAANADQSFFFEASSPYIQNFNLGDYDIAVRAYDLAGNYTQSVARLSVQQSVSQIFTKDGLRILNRYTVSWPLLAIIGALILLLLILLLRKLLRSHKNMDYQLAQGAAQHPEIAEKLEELRAKQKEYEEAVKRALVLLLCLGFAWNLLRAQNTPLANAATNAEANLAIPSANAADTTPLLISSPLINLAPTSITNNQVLYLGGWANVADANVIISIERTETGETFSGAAKTGPDGNWFYSFPQLLDAGHYVAWAQLKVASQTSAPSARVDIAVEPIALQLGIFRFNYQQLYFALALIFFLAFLFLLGVILFHARALRKKKTHFADLVRNAEDSVRRGFSILRRDIELELATVAKAKLEGELSMEEKIYEAKLLHDLDAVDRYIGKEVWKIEEGERELS